VKDQRSVALSRLLGDTRSYLLQLEYGRAELKALKQPDLGLLLLAIDGAQTAVGAVDSIATEKSKAASAETAPGT
jgi:hypothetical protein